MTTLGNIVRLLEQLPDTPGVRHIIVDEALFANLDSIAKRWGGTSASGVIIIGNVQFKKEAADVGA